MTACALEPRETSQTFSHQGRFWSPDTQWMREPGSSSPFAWEGDHLSLPRNETPAASHAEPCPVAYDGDPPLHDEADSLRGDFWVGVRPSVHDRARIEYDDVRHVSRVQPTSTGQSEDVGREAGHLAHCCFEAKDLAFADVAAQHPGKASVQARVRFSDEMVWIAIGSDARVGMGMHLQNVGLVP